MSIRGYRPRLYGIWLKMRSRCNTATCKHFAYYGGRGISVCPEWDDFAKFRAWALANGYSDSLTLDRINNDGNYEPNNCRWATHSEQARNTRRNLVVEYGGEALPLIAWAERTGIPYAKLRTRFKLGWPAAQILDKEQRPAPIAERKWSKLTEDQVKDIRASSLSGVEAARKYSVSKSLVSRIRSGTAWTQGPRA